MPEIYQKFLAFSLVLTSKNLIEKARVLNLFQNLESRSKTTPLCGVLRSGRVQDSI